MVVHVGVLLLIFLLSHYTWRWFFLFVTVLPGVGALIESSDVTSVRLFAPVVEERHRARFVNLTTVGSFHTASRYASRNRREAHNYFQRVMIYRTTTRDWLCESPQSRDPRYGCCWRNIYYYKINCRLLNNFNYTNQFFVYWFCERWWS